MGARQARCKRQRPFGPGRHVFLHLTAILIGSILLTACGSGGGSSAAAPAAATALSLPSRITLSSAENTSNSAATLAVSPMAVLSKRYWAPSAFNDSSTDYTNQTKATWLEDTDALDMVNQILGVMADSGYQNFLNAGPYKALVKPIGKEKQSQGGTSTTSTTAEELMEIVVDVSRESDSDPMVVKVWVKIEDGPGGMAMLVRGYFSVSAGVNAQYPYGVMEAHFKGNVLGADGVEGDQVFTMAMSIGADDSGNVIVQFIDQGSENGGMFMWDNRARVVANSTLTAGNAYVYSEETDFDTGFPEVETSYFAYNEDYFKYQVEGSPDVITQDKNDLRHKIYKYKLFDYDSGAKVVLNSGFGLRLANGQYGYVGYHGLWVPYGLTVSNGDTVTRADDGQTYTLVNIGGKLTRHTRASIPLSELDGVEISVWDNGSDIIVAWNAAENKFQKIGTRLQTGQIQYLDPAAYVDFSFDEPWMGGWCESLSAFLPLGRLTSDTVYYHTEEVVSGSLTENLPLYYWGFALDAPISQAVINAANEAEQAYFAAPQPVEKTYTFDAAANLLQDGDGDDVLLGPGINVAGTKYGHGYNMGPLTAADTYDAATCWAIFDSEVYYQWTTGPNPWNRFSTVRDGSGTLVAFDPPLAFTYTHLTANDVNDDATHNGRKFRLEYDGSELRIPWQFDPATGEWWPAINLKDGTVLTDGNGGQYVVKAVEEALIMAEAADPSLAADLVIDTGVQAPTITYDASKTALVGEASADAELKVIKGEVVQD